MILFIVTILLLVVIAVQIFSNNNLSIGGFRVFMIISESMADRSSAESMADVSGLYSGLSLR